MSDLFEQAKNWSNEFPRCPHCGQNYKDAWEIGFGRNQEDEAVVECGKCEKEFAVRRVERITYDTRILTHQSI